MSKNCSKDCGLNIIKQIINLKIPKPLKIVFINHQATWGPEEHKRQEICSKVKLLCIKANAIGCVCVFEKICFGARH
jgi:hypothetical protein